MRCPTCQREVASDAVTCPHCGHPLEPGEYERQRNAAETERARKRKAVLILGAFVLFLMFLGSLSKSKTAKTAQIAGPPPIPVQVVEEWKIPAGGYGRTIVIDSAYRNEPDMRRLGDQLHNADRWAKNTSIDVYDHPGAAKLRQAGMAERLPPKAQKEHDRHRIGVYLRNGQTGYESWMMALKGMEGKDWPTIEVKYSDAR